MKKIIIKDMKKYSLVAIMMAATFFAACSGEENIICEQPATGTFTLTVNALKGDEDATRALTLDGNALKATWKAGDAVTVYNVTRSANLTGTLIAQSDGQSTTLHGTLTGTIETNDELKLKFLSPTYSSQDGTLAGIAATCDYAEATVTVSAVSGGSITTSSATFENKQSIVEFTLMDKATNTALNATELTVYAGTTSINVTPTSATNVLYVAIPGISSQDVYLSATASDVDYIYEKSGVTLSNGKFYGYTVSMNEVPSAISEPLTFEARIAEAKISFKKGANVANQIEYSRDGGSTWTIYSDPIILANVGDKVSFRGNNAAYGDSDLSNCSSFSCSGNCYIYGNIMSLINSTGFATATELTAPYTFYNLFAYCSIWSHPTKKLELPATKLTESCYQYMFESTFLSTSPKLPATTLAYGCYSCMFDHCVFLTTAPKLPATTLVYYCYEYMFWYCSSLTTAPDLPATTLVDGCYQNMFDHCTSLNSVKCLATNISANDCTRNWLNFVAATGTFTKATGVNWSGKTGVSGIPSGWTVQEE